MSEDDLSYGRGSLLFQSQVHQEDGKTKGNPRLDQTEE
jgi:hypothetical protein